MTGREEEGGEQKKQVVAVVGAGLVGSLEACLLAQRGLEVSIKLRHWADMTHRWWQLW
jgi:2-polyprenyl-6-methoxyphenol hydroxylase-like FAD-dependent oxidoreductase